MRNWVVLMIVTVSTVKRQPEKCLPRILNVVPHPFIGIQRIIIPNQITGGRPGRIILRCDFVRSQHLLNHPVIAFIIIE